MSRSTENSIGARKPALATVAFVLVLFALCQACENPPGPVSPARETSLEITIPRLSPVFAEAFAQGGNEAGAKALASGRALIGATRVDFRLCRKGESAALVEWSVTASQYPSSTSFYSKKAVPEDSESCVLSAKVYNEAVSATVPVVTGSADVDILPLSSSYVTVTCVPASPTVVDTGYSATVNPKPFVLSASTIKTMGQELWYEFTPKVASFALSLRAQAGNSNRIACCVYDATGNRFFKDASHEFTVTASSPAEKWVSVTPGAKYYIGLAQSSSSPGSQDGIEMEITESPATTAAPAAPVLAASYDRPGSLDVSWTPAAGVTGYDVYYYEDFYQPTRANGNTPVAADAKSWTITGLKPGYKYNVYLVGRRPDSFNWSSANGAVAAGWPVHARSSVSDGTRIWSNEAVGAIADGSAGFNQAGSTFTITGGGREGFMDGRLYMQYLHLPIDGNFTLTARLASVSGTCAASNHPNEPNHMHSASVGVSVCDGVSVYPKDYRLGLGFNYSWSSSATVNSTGCLYYHEGGNVCFDSSSTRWIRLERVGTTLSYSTSVDGSTWTPRKLATSSDGSFSAATLEVGFFVIADTWQDSETATVTFDNVTLVTP